MRATASPPVRIAPVAAGWAAAVTGVAVAGGIGSDTSSDWYRDLEKPSWQPPGAVFGPVWTILYVLIAIAATLAVRDVPGVRRRIVAGLFAANLALNVAWTWIFFTAKRPRWSLAEILLLEASSLGLIRRSARVDGAAAGMLVPYAAWTAFATVLNAAIVNRNPQA